MDMAINFNEAFPLCLSRPPCYMAGHEKITQQSRDPAVDH